MTILFFFQGAIASKTVMGVPFYRWTFNLLNPHDARMGARATKTGFPGPYTKENGFLGYNEVCECNHRGLSHLNRDKIESNLSVLGIQGCLENALIKSFEMNPSIDMSLR